MYTQARFLAGDGPRTDAHLPSLRAMLQRQSQNQLVHLPRPVVVRKNRIPFAVNTRQRWDSQVEAAYGMMLTVMESVRVIVRLLHHATTLNIKGESFRLKEKRKAGLLTQSLEQSKKEKIVS